MRLPVLSYKACVVDEHCHIELLHCHVMQYLVVGSLHKSRIYRKKRFEASRGKSGAEGHRMAFRYAYVKKSFGIFFGKAFKSYALRHSCGNRNHSFILAEIE